MKINEKKVIYTITPEPEFIPIEQALGEKETGTDSHAEYITRVHKDDGYNVWLWCSVKVSAKLPGLPEIEGTAYLGGCAYENEADFRRGGYLEQMQADALEDLQTEVNKIAAVICPTPLQRVASWWQSLKAQTI